MDFSYCVNGKYPADGSQPPACYYNSNGDFIGIDYTSTQTIPLLNKQFDHNKDGSPLEGPPQYVAGNVVEIKMPPNGWTKLYSTGNCGGNDGIIINGSSQVDDPNHQLNCFQVGTTQSWLSYVDGCRKGIGDPIACQQYAPTGSTGSNIPSGNITIIDPDNNRWWIYLVLGILLVLIIMLVLAGVYVSSKPHKNDIKPPIVIQSPKPASSKPSTKIAEPTKSTTRAKETIYYEIK